MGKEVTGQPQVAPPNDPKKVEPDLPPPGDERRETLSQRQDELDRKAEEQAAAEDRYAVDPSKLRVENEIVGQRDALDVTGRLPEYHYIWVLTSHSGRYVQSKLAKRYEVVRADMPEATELKQADGTRRLGDVLLMRIHRDLYRVELDQRERRRQAREQGVNARLLELKDKFAKHGAVVHVDGEVPENILEAMQKNAQAKEISGRMMDNFIRQGRVPGMPMRGRNRR